MGRRIFHGKNSQWNFQGNNFFRRKILSIVGVGISIENLEGGFRQKLRNGQKLIIITYSNQSNKNLQERIIHRKFSKKNFPARMGLSEGIF